MTAASPRSAKGVDTDDDAALLERIQRDSFRLFREHGKGDDGLVADSSQARSPCSIAAVGFALSSYPVAVEHGWMTRGDALALTIAALRFFDSAGQSGTPSNIGHNGFFFHFLHMTTGERIWDSEVSAIDTALLLAGMLFAARYFSRADAAEN